MTLKSLLRFAAMFAFAFSISCLGQSGDLKAYTTCDLGTDFRIVDVDGPVTDFAWPTPTKAGKVSISVETGYRVLVTYKTTERFGNLKIERLPKAQYADEKANLRDSLQYLSTEPGMDGKVQTVSKNGLTLYGISRNNVEGGVLSVYYLFRDEDNIAVSMYLLNAEPDERKFSTLEEYRAIVDKFLDAYTKCVAPSPKAH
jgi:hypothetical protein